MRKVVITGLGFVTSIGNTKKQVMNSLINMNSGIELFQPFLNNDKIPVKVAGTIKGFNIDSEDQEDWTGTSLKIEKTLKKDKKRGMSPHVFYAVHALESALEDSNLNYSMISNPRVGLYTASSGSSLFMYRNIDTMHKRGVMRCKPLSIVNSVVGTLTFNLTSIYNILGSSTGFASACASSGHAIGHAMEEIKNDRQDIMIIVGGEDCTLETILPFAGMRVLSTEENPKKASRPFDKNRKGFVGTGGSVVMILEEEKHALKRNAKIYSEFLSWGQATDGYHTAKPHPDGLGLMNSIKNALKSGNIDQSKVDYINAHGTGTQPGDFSEMKALKQVFNNSFPYISSTKALTGHGLSLASIMEAAFCNLCIENQFIPGSANIENLDENFKELNIITESKKLELNIVLSNSSGFGGANTALLFKKYE